MKERPINCTADEVRGLLAGTLTELRREIKSQPVEGMDGFRGIAHHVIGSVWRSGLPWSGSCPLGRKGNALWVREGLNIVDWGVHFGACVQWAASADDVSNHHGVLGWTHDVAGVSLQWGKPGPNADWKNAEKPLRVIPSSRMPRWASRLMLTITDVRVEREGDRWVWCVQVARTEGEGQR